MKTASSKSPALSSPSWPSKSISTSLLVATVLAGVSAWAASRYFLGGLALPASCKLFGLGCPPVLPSRGFVHPEHKYIEPLFHKIFVEGDDVGASFTAYVDGVKIAELYGGHTDKTYTTPYTEDTLQLVFSSSKMVTTFAVLSLLDRGAIPSLDVKVADYWPEFAEGGKENVTISQLLSHRAGLPFLDPERAPGVKELGNLDGLARKIAGQPHAFGGEVRSAYHALAGGWFVNEFVRRADPKGRSIRYVVQEDILPIISSSTPSERPYEFYLGLTDEQYPTLIPRVAPVIGLSMLQSVFNLLVPHSIQHALGSVPISAVMFDAIMDPTSICAKAVFRSGPTFDPTWKQFPETYNNEYIWRSENPSFGGLTNARTLARLAAFMVHNGTLDGVTLFQPSTMRAALELQDARMDDVVQSGWGSFDTQFVNGTTFYGWSGSGGSIILWSYELNLAVSYVMNVGHFEMLGDKRSRTIVEGISVLAIAICSYIECNTERFASASLLLRLHQIQAVSLGNITPLTAASSRRHMRRNRQRRFSGVGTAAGAAVYGQGDPQRQFPWTAGLLSWWKYSGLPLKYDEEPLRAASYSGRTDILQWWKDSGLQLKYNETALTAASSQGHVSVAVVEGYWSATQWWKDCGLEFRCDRNGRSQHTAGRTHSQWWKDSGCELRYTRNAVRVATSDVRVEILQWWRDIRLEDASHTKVLDWWEGSDLFEAMAEEARWTGEWLWRTSLCVQVSFENRMPSKNGGRTGVRH
ncbi:beta-lactamase/transpeptidase-like protein [Zopfochytrium polystomum]|nr:beta-lactamase/transpeptidase-like protein [Zopfochytrium polystomum]